MVDVAFIMPQYEFHANHGNFKVRTQHEKLNLRARKDGVKNA